MKCNNFFKKTACLVLIVFLAFNIGINTNFIAATTYTNINAKEISNESIIKDAKKVWRIKFNKNIDESSMLSNIYVVDSSNNKIGTNLKLLSDKKTVELSAIKEYEVNKSYKIYVNDIKGENGERLSKQVIYSFKLEELNGNDISIKTNISTLLTYIQINTSKEVFKVTVNNIEMKYEGNNNYALGLSDIGVGKKVIIQIFDKNNKLLDKKEHIISQ
ncbi:hypothetical protein LGK97_05925 [Clostridium sp. CS001]|uniref:Ig-like domain-containing protein n=1 Tax=Clostridium sp. CS001 TaxID=2880648 RepID=UPI001CF4EC5E|nr:Ig-like domain-containing protein [Clostridium sp. CS001]MCB2289301.1 hypothetical protein [Clostridium sp. CS001]